MKRYLLFVIFFISFSVSNAQIISTVVGTGVQGALGDSGLATLAQLNLPTGIDMDTTGNLYVADHSNRVRMVDAKTGIITTIAGTGASGYSGDGGPATKAMLKNPWGIAVDDSGNVYIADLDNYRVRKVTAATGKISTIAYPLIGMFSLGLDKARNVYITDGGGIVKKLDVSAGTLKTIIGGGTQTYADGLRADSVKILSSIEDVTVDDSGNIFIAQFSGNKIGRVDGVTHIITTVAGNGTNTYAGDGGLATLAGVKEPISVTVDKAGNLYITGYENVVRRVDAATKIITTMAGTGTANSFGDGGLATAAGIKGPKYTILDKNGSLYVTEYSHRVRKITQSISTGERGADEQILLSTYPVPAAQRLWINLPGDGYTSVALYDLTGRAVYHLVTKPTAMDMSIPVSVDGLTNGLYIIKAQKQQGVTSGRVLVQH